MIVKLKNVRIAFCQDLFKAGAMNSNDKPSFKSTFLMPKDDPQVKTVQQAIEAVALEKWGQKAAAFLKDLKINNKLCLKDGDGKSQYDGFEGNMFISSSNPSAPTVIDIDKTPLTEASGKIYAGCYVDASLDIWAQENDYGKRINAKLRAVRFRGDGDAFVGSAPATEDEFDDLADTGDDDLV